MGWLSFCFMYCIPLTKETMLYYFGIMLEDVRKILVRYYADRIFLTIIGNLQN